MNVLSKALITSIGESDCCSLTFLTGFFLAGTGYVLLLIKLLASSRGQ